MVARSSTLASSRTLPGQEYSASFACPFTVTRIPRRPVRCTCSCSSASQSCGRSTMRSRSGGRCKGKTLSR